MPSVLGIDPSIKCTGWAFGNTADMKPLVGHHRFAEEGADVDRVWARALMWINGMIGQYKPDVVAIEAPAYGMGSKQTTDVALEGLSAVLRTVAFVQLGYPALLIPTSTAAKALTGKGVYPRNEKKPAVFAKCCQLGWVEGDEPYDVTDACAVWVAACMKADQAFAANFIPLMTSMKGLRHVR